MPNWFMDYEVVTDRFGMYWICDIKSFKDATALKDLWNETEFKETRRLAEVEFDFDSHEYKVILRNSYV